MKRLGILLIFLLSLSAFFMSNVARAQAPQCDPAGNWLREDKTQKIEIYQSESKWYGKITWASDKNTKPGFLMLRDFVYDEGKRQYKGRVIIPSSGMEASADLACVDENTIRVTGHKLFVSKSYIWKKAEN